MNVERVRLPRKLTKSVSGGVLAEAGRLHPVGALNITLNMLPIHRVTMTLAEDDLDLAMHDLVEVYNQNGSVGIYRVTKITNTLRKERKIELSHGLDVFSDATIARITDSWNGSVRDYLQMIIDGQTQTIGGQFYWQLGRCDDTSYWEKDLKYDNAMSLLTDLAKTEEDYMFTFDQSTFPWTLNFIRRDATVLSEFRLRRNTESCVVTFDDSDLCTRLYLSVTTEEDDEDGYGTYFEEGYYTFDDTAAQAIYGIVCKTAGIDQSVFSPTVDLEAWKNAYFERHNAPNVQITIDGMELNKHSREPIDEMHLGRMCRVALPDYGNTFNERIVSVNYPDALRKTNYVRVSLHNKRETAEDAFQEISDTASSASSSASSGGKSSHNDATYFRRTIGDTANGLYSRIEQTAYYIRSEVVDTANGLYSKIEQTASYIRSEVANTANGLESRIEQTASYIRSEVSDTANGLNSKIEQTASSLRSTIRDTKSDLQSQIDQNASQIALRVSKGEVGTQLAVELGNVSITGGNLNVDGYVKASELTATYINSLFSGTQVFSSNYAFIRNLECTNFTQGEYTMDLSDAVSNVKIELNSGNTYTLYKKHFYSSDWVSAGNFSRAVTSIDWSWSGGMAKAVLTPQNQTFYSKQIDAIQPHGQATWDTDKKGFTVTLDVDDTDGTTVFSDEMHFNTTTSYDQGHTDGYGVAKGTYTKSNGVLKVSKSTGGTAFPLSFAIDAGIEYNSSTHKYTAKALCDDDLMDSTESGTQAYDAGVQVGEAEFIPHADITPIGSTSIRVGTALTVTPISSTKIRVGAATNVTPISGSGVTPTKRVVSVASGNGTLYLRNTSALKLKHDGSKTYYVAPSVGAQGYTRDWYYVDSGGTSYYTSAGIATKYDITSATYYDVGSAYEGATLYKAGTTNSYRRNYSTSGSDGTAYYTAGTAEVYYPGLSSGGTVYYTPGTKVTGLYTKAA